MKQVLLLGDSIRLLYENKVKELLGKEYNVSSPLENCKFSTYTLNTLHVWLNQFPKPDIIHWNNGLWDTAINYVEDGCFTPIELYLQNLSKILRELKKTGAKIIFATTTPTDEKKSELRGGFSQHNISDIERYNEKAVEFMKSQGVEINDLFPLILGKQLEYINQEDLIHPNEKGVEVLAVQVANKIKEIR